MRQRAHLKALLSALPWLFGFAFSLPLIAVAVSDLAAMMLHSVPGPELLFTAKQLDIANDTAKTLLPMSTGYLIAAAPVLKYLHQQRQLTRPIVIFGLAAVFTLGIAAIGLWTGVFAFLIGAANAFERCDKLAQTAELNRQFGLALLCARMAHLCFFASVAWFVATATEILFLSDNGTNETGSQDASQTMRNEPSQAGDARSADQRQ